MMKRQIQMRYMQMALCDAQVGRCAPESTRLVLGCSVLNGEVVADDRVACGQAAGGGHGGMTHSTLTPSWMPRMDAAKPPSGAWIVSQRAGPWPSVRNEWATCGGAARKPPAATVIVSVSRPISKISSPSTT
jgi:hypothetical protein